MKCEAYCDIGIWQTFHSQSIWKDYTLSALYETQ